MNKEFGIRFQGLEEPLEEILKEHIKDKNEYLFLEIGVAAAKTHRAIRDIISENIKTNHWLTIGLDIIGSLDVDFNQINKIFSPDELIVNESQNDLKLEEKLGKDNHHSVLVLRLNPREWIKNIDDNSLSLCFIDANHNRENFLADFLAIENKMKIGGLVLSHDSGLEEMGTDYQGKNSEGEDTYIDVYGGLLELGLFDNKRNGWKFIAQLPGTRKSFNNPDGGNSLCILEKI